MDRPVNLDAALASIDEPWSPLTVAVVNDYDARVARVEGTFEWHSHPETDELFVVLSGRLTIGMDEGDVELAPNDVYVVPRGRRHRPSAPDGATILITTVLSVATVTILLYAIKSGLLPGDPFP